MPTYYTTEDQLVSDLVSYWNTTPPTGLPNGTPIVSFRRQGVLAVPAVIVGHEGFEREKAKGMTGTGKVALRIAYRTSLDVTTEAIHHAAAAALDRAISALALGNGALALSYVHAVLRESPISQIEDRRQYTVLRYQVVATRCESA
jgi:hypothetical protein